MNRSERVGRYDYDYWDHGTRVLPWWHGKGKVYMPSTRSTMVAIGAADYGPYLTREMEAVIGRLEFGPTQIPSTEEAIPWFLSTLDDDQREIAEALIEMVDRW